MADKLKVVITDDQKEVKVQTGTRMLIRRCCHAVLENERFPGSAEIGITFTDNQRLNEYCIEHFGRKAVASHVAFTTAHGVLALLGYSPDDERDKAYVRDRVELIMYQLGIPISSRQFFS